MHSVKFRRTLPTLRAVCVISCNLQWLCLIESRLKITLEQLAGVVEILLGVGGRDRQPRKSLVQNGDDALLFGEWRDWNAEAPQGFARKVLDARACEVVSE